MDIIEAVNNFVAEHPELNEQFVEKLRWADTDLSRYSNAYMRMRQYVEHLKRQASPGDCPPEAVRQPDSVSMGICDLAHAMHTWRRQLQFWHGYFIHADATWPPDQPAEARPQHTADPGSNLPPLAKMQRALLSLPRPDAEGGWMTTAVARKQLKGAFRKHKAAAAAGEPSEAADFWQNPAVKLKEAIDDLCVSRLVEKKDDAAPDGAAGAPAAGAGEGDAGEEEPAVAPKARGGWSKTTFRKCQWSHILASDVAQAAVLRLRLSGDDFL